MKEDITIFQKLKTKQKQGKKKKHNCGNLSVSFLSGAELSSHTTLEVRVILSAINSEANPCEELQ